MTNASPCCAIPCPTATWSAGRTALRHAEDLDAGKCTVEEREEYEPHVARAIVVFAGVDYERILRAAETEADVILWDGGNNDLLSSGLTCWSVSTRCDPATSCATARRGEPPTADIVVVTKVDTAPAPGPPGCWRTSPWRQSLTPP